MIPTPVPLAVAIIGASRVPDNELKPHDLHLRMIAEALSTINATVLTGACHGFPMALAAHARDLNITTIGFSPGSNLHEHLDEYQSPVETTSLLLFVGGGLMTRGVKMVRQCDIAIALGGNLGTLCEALMCIKERKRLLVADDVGRFPQVLRHVLENLTAYPNPIIHWLPIAQIAEQITQNAVSWTHHAHPDSLPITTTKTFSSKSAKNATSTDHI